MLTTLLLIFVSVSLNKLRMNILGMGAQFRQASDPWHCIHRYITISIIVISADEEVVAGEEHANVANPNAFEPIAAHLVRKKTCAIGTDIFPFIWHGN